MVNLKGNKVSPRSREPNNNPIRETSAHQLQEGGKEAKALEKDSILNQENCFAISVGTTRAILQRIGR
jgi:hypothetical protein